MNNTIKTNKLLFLCSLCLLFFASCNDDLEDKKTNLWDTSDVWTISTMARGVLNKAYEGMPTTPDSYGSNYLDAATDNAMTTIYDNLCYRLASGEMTQRNNLLGVWGTAYEKFQYIHQFLLNGLGDNVYYVRGNDEQDLAYKKRLEGEAYFLRAYWGYRLLQVYGGKTDDGQALGYPIVTSFLTMEEMEHANLPRDTYEACATQIMNDCDRATELLPLEYKGSDNIIGITQLGRASALAAKALKTQVALLAASPAFQPDSIVKINGMGNYTILDETVYKQKWVRAAEVADQCIKTTGFGGVYGLKATDLADAPNKTPSEFILRSYFNNNTIERRYFAPFYLGTARTVPSQNLVDAFPAANGFPISDSRSNYDSQSPYINRDKRLDLNVYHQGSTYGKNGLLVNTSDDGEFGRLFSEHNSQTGYYLAKGISKSQNMLDIDATKNAIHYYPLLRKTQVYLAYAEAANEAWGPMSKSPEMSNTAYDIIKSLRKVSGGITSTTYLDEMAADVASFRKLIHNERRIELAFESSRYWDLRRWLDPLDESVRGVEVSLDDQLNTVYSYMEVAPRNYHAIRDYYVPLPYSEILKMPNLINNLGWN